MLLPSAAASLLLLILPLPSAVAWQNNFGIGDGSAKRVANTLPTSQHDFAPVRAYINKTISEKQLPSVSVAVAQHGRIIWEESFGWADREKLVPAKPDTLYALASLTKPYTS